MCKLFDLVFAFLIWKLGHFEGFWSNPLSDRNLDFHGSHDKVIRFHYFTIFSPEYENATTVNLNEW